MARYLATFSAAVPAASWTGEVASCQPGNLSAGYRSAILDRVNWYRAMAGTLEGVVEEPAFTTNAQAAALITSANSALSHEPPMSWACWTSSGHNGASNSNLYLGRTGAPAHDGGRASRQLTDSSRTLELRMRPWDTRAWLLDPTQVRMGVGAIPSGSPVSEAIYVIDPPNLFTPTPPPVREANGYVSWPPSGFVPSSTVYPR